MRMGTAGHTRLQRLVLSVLAIVTVTAGLPSPVSADEDDTSLRNGGFEKRTLANWRTDDLEGFDLFGWSAVAGTRSPVNRFDIPRPTRGRFQAVVEQMGPGSHILYRDIKVDDDDLGLTLTLWYQNLNGSFFTPSTLDPSNEPNQQLRVDIMRPGAPLRSMAAGDILATVFRTKVGDPSQVAPIELRQSLARFEDQTIRLRIAEVDNQFFFLAGVDAVRLVEIDDDEHHGHDGRGGHPGHGGRHGADPTWPSDAPDVGGARVASRSAAVPHAMPYQMP